MRKIFFQDMTVHECCTITGSAYEKMWGGGEEGGGEVLQLVSSSGSKLHSTVDNDTNKNNPCHEVPTR